MDLKVLNTKFLTFETVRLQTKKIHMMDVYVSLGEYEFVPHIWCCLWLI